MDTYEALLASMDYLVKPTRQLSVAVSKAKVEAPTHPISQEIGNCCFDQVTPENWIHNPLNQSK